MGKGILNKDIMAESEVTIRFAVEEDKKYWIQWIKDPSILHWFPMCNDLEIEDAARLIFSFVKHQAVLTAEIEGKPVGIANLNLHPFQRLSHQALITIIVEEKRRGKGVGTKLMQKLIFLAKEKFHMEMIHLEVYEGNPAKRLYERLGFTPYGYQEHFTKEEGSYLGKYLMQKNLA